EPVDINKASAKEIAAALEGIGDKKAAAVVIYRENNGHFKSIDELRNIKGIGYYTIEKNKDNIKLKGSKSKKKMKPKNKK
ncbi:MAG TPA: helix-hairpin-helix domain-containing protein, partial [Gammaproteobacteria bacterium]|nr:helix-hairpin-helix domain-containing protein [Gammaproteobacteria bacterium]